jgi:multicomponent Na+:H+ antiporter subunit G
MTEVISDIGYLLIVIGIAFDVLGCLGLMRLPDIYNRLQAATKCVTFGTCAILVGVALRAIMDTENVAIAIKAVLCAIFVLLTSPVAAHALAKGAHMSGVKLWEKSVVDKYDEDVDHEAHSRGA